RLTAGFSTAGFGITFSGRATGRFRTLVSAVKNSVPGAEKVWWRELRLGAVAAGCALRLKSVNVKKWNQGWARPSRSNCSDHSAGAPGDQQRGVCFDRGRWSRGLACALPTGAHQPKRQTAVADFDASDHGSNAWLVC